jgi:polyene glycosyltransferase
MDLGDCGQEEVLTQTLERAAAVEDYMVSAREMLHWAISLHLCMFTSLHAQIAAMPRKPTIIVTDFATYAGPDIAEAFHIPFIVNNPDLVNMLSPDDVPPYDFIPGTMTAASIQTVNSRETWWGLGPRLLYPPIRMLLRAVVELTAGKELGEHQKAAGLEPSGIFTRFTGHLILVNNVFGLEYARNLPPNVVLVGPMLEKRWHSHHTQARDEYGQQLSEEDSRWLESSKGVPVVWVSMGTISPLNERQVVELYTAFREGALSGRFRVLWKLDQKDHAYLPDAKERPSEERLKVTTWVSSQLGVLGHHSTALFLSHCGINSVHESIYLGTPLLCIPILADQADMAARVEDAGVGKQLKKSTFTASTLLDALDALLLRSTPSQVAAADARTSALAKVRAAMRLAGGVERAVDYIEYVAQHGVSSLVPVDVLYPWFIRFHLDVWLLYALALWLTWRWWRWLCCKVRPGKECVEDRKRIKAQAAAYQRRKEE